MPNVLEIESLRKSFLGPDGKQSTVLDIASFLVADGESVAMRGESGTGKTTLLNVIAGILRADDGRVTVAGREMSALSERARDRARADSIGYIFQTFHLLQGLTVLENVTLGMAFGGNFEKDRGRELLKRMGIDSHAAHLPRTLSVGQQQRVAIARALANKPRLVLADEPTGNLDTGRARKAVALIREVCRENGAALLLVSHDPSILAGCDRIIPLAEINRAGQAS